jgi:diguanylate cyclase
MQKQNKNEEFAADWQNLHQQMTSAMRQLVSETVDRHAHDLASLFYNYMEADKEAASFLSHELVTQRLHTSMQGWLRDLFSMKQKDPQEIYKYQCHVGVVHARIQIPIALVLRGTRILKQAITELLVETTLDRAGLVQATRFVSEVMELSMSAMTDSYIINVGKSVRTDESYRMFALGQNMLAERERQRAALSEWAQHILLHLLGDGVAGMPEMRHSEFGMWLQHKASIIFHDAPELERIRGCVEKLERTLLPSLIEKRRQGGDAREAMKQVEADIGEVKFLLTGLFDRFIEVESGRDALTRLLNRRYLPTILMREVALARRGNVPFAVLLIDIDHFKNINDTHGHDSGDMVLQQAADLVTTSVRVGDFIFRYGGEELLVVLVEIDKDQAMYVAETIRARFAAEPLRVGDGKTMPVTVSIGVAAFNGHPDYERIVKEADDALYSAKKAGRNRCVLAAS